MAKGGVRDVDHGWRAMMRAALELQGGAYAKVGVLGDEPHPGGDLTVAEIAAIQEFGTEDGHVPERSFIRSTFDRMREELQALSAKLVAAVVLDRKMSVEKALNILGMKLAAETKKTITESPLPGVGPANAPSTAKAKGGTPETVRTLVDTARMVGAITWAVVTGRAGRAILGGGSEK